MFCFHYFDIKIKKNFRLNKLRLNGTKNIKAYKTSAKCSLKKKIVILETIRCMQCTESAVGCLIYVRKNKCEY